MASGEGGVDTYAYTHMYTYIHTCMDTMIYIHIGGGRGKVELRGNGLGWSVIQKESSHRRVRESKTCVHRRVRESKSVCAPTHIYTYWGEGRGVYREGGRELAQETCLLALRETSKFLLQKLNFLTQLFVF